MKSILNKNLFSRIFKISKISHTYNFFNLPPNKKRLPVAEKGTTSCYYNKRLRGLSVAHTNVQVQEVDSGKGKGNKKSESENNNVRWEAVLEEDKGEDFEERKSLEPVASFPQELRERNQFVTNISVLGDNVQITRASVYVKDDDEPSRSLDRVPYGIRKVNSNSKLLDMDTAAVTFSESESSVEDFADDVFNNRSLYRAREPKEVVFDYSEPSGNDESSPSKMCYGPDLRINISPIQGTSVLSTFVQDVENELQSPAQVRHVIGDCNSSKELKFDSNNSLDIERELNELMGTLCTEIEEKMNNISINNIVEADTVPRKQANNEGSNINLAFYSSEVECDEDESTSSDSKSRQFHTEVPSSDNYWKNQRLKSKSFADRYKLGNLLRRGKQRMSMIEFGSRRTKSNDDTDEEHYATGTHTDKSALVGEATQQPPHFLRLAYDRSSVVEPRVTSTINLPVRPQSALDDTVRRYAHSSGSSIISQPTEGSVSSSFRSSFRSNHRPSSQRMSEGFDDCIDWSWLEEAMKSLNTDDYDYPTHKNSSSLRVDAGCQTQSDDQSWQGEEERMRSEAPSPRVSDTNIIGVSSECRVVESRGCDEVMPCKPFIEGSGTSGVSTWLRQSMRRVRHFNLGDPPRIRSAPPDSLRTQTESEDSERVVNQTVASTDRVTTGNETIQQQVPRPRSEENRSQRTRAFRTRPSSAPNRRSYTEATASHHQSQQQSETETANSTPSSEAQDNLGYESDSTDRHPSPRRRRRRHGDDESEESEGRSPLGPWPHGLSSVFAGLGCTLGLFNISRFAILSVHFGSNFILQFLILSFLLGVPLLAFHAALGQTLGAGPVDMWKISPLFQGVGIALLLAQALIGMYSIVGVSWMFVYFRDSFITKQDAFRWAEPFRHYREDNIFATSILNTSGRLEETVPDYLNGVVLQRHGLTSPENVFGHLKFQLTFNLAVVWMIVFVSLSKGLRSYGKVVYVFSVVPVLGVLVICSKLLGLTPLHRGFFPQTEWSEFFINAKSWISAATEVMLTWNLLGAATMQVTSHNRSSKKLWRDVATIILLTLLVLILSAFLGNMCHQLISLKGYSYVPSSFERISTYSFLRPSGAALPPSYAVPVRHMAHASLMAGERIAKPGAFHESGYQVIRLATELVPTTLAILDGDYLSPFWAVLFYFTLILFGIAQQLAIWHCVITGIMAINAPSLKSWETTITFFTCAAGFILGLPMTTELGIFVVYFLDYCLGGGWWVVLLTLMEICAVLMVRGRPYSGENISIALFGKTNNCISLWAIPLLTFAWNVIMPVALLIMCITIFKSGGYRDLWVWRCGKGDYWPLWTREVGVFVQIIPLLCIPIVAVVQCYRYLSKGPADIFDRLANLYRPPSGINGLTDIENTATTPNTLPTDSGTNGATDLPPAEDPPPKYTPPPSYSTATGTRIAKLLRQSFRRSVRRIQSVLGPDVVQPPRPPPPDYASVLVEMNQNRNEEREIIHSSESNNLTAADVAQVLRCSFRRTNNNNNSNTSPSHNNSTTNNTASQNLVIHPRWNQ